MSEKTQNAFQKYIIPAILAVALIGVILWAAQQKALEVLTQPDSPLTASMLRDLEAGQRIEAEQIVGAVLAEHRRFQRWLRDRRTVLMQDGWQAWAVRNARAGRTAAFAV